MIKPEDLIKTVSKMFYPQRCVCCGKIIKDDLLCDDCTNLERITVKVCGKCGLATIACDCKKNAFHFDGMVGVFYNTGKAQKIVYRFKNLADTDTADFLAQNIAERIKDRLPELKFDGVCAIPLRNKKKLKRGYNQSDLIAKRVAKLLGADYYKSGLSKIKNGAVQHKLKYEDRFLNVRGMYKANMRFDGKKILLIDDIRTSGATFDECARVLKRAGASCVIAASALITQNYIEKAYKN